MKPKKNLLAKECGATATDFFLLVFLVACLSVGTFLFRQLLGEGNSPKETVTYRVFIDEIDEEFAGNLNTGTLLFSSESKQRMGRVTAVETREAGRYLYSEAAGGMVFSPLPGKRSLLLTLTATGSTEGGVLIGGRRLYLGETLHLRCASLAFAGEVDAIL